MQERGIRVDVEGMKKIGEDYARKIDETTDQLRKAVGYDINPNSPKQLADYFYSKRGLPAYRKRGGGVTTDDTALKRLTRKGIREATLVRQIREYAKAHSNYLNTEKVDLDGRIRCSYNPAGTRFSRISSSENIFGTGCLMPDAEVLTPLGWVAFKSLSEGLDTMQWNLDGRLSWCTPIIHKYAYEGSMIQASSNLHSNLYTPDHRIPKLTKRGFLHTDCAEILSKESNWFLPLSGQFKSGTLKFLGIRLLVAIQADGSIEGNGIRISLKKKRKISRLLKLFSELEIDYTEQAASEGYRRFYIRVADAAPYIMLLNMEGKKCYGSWLMWLDEETARELLDEIPYWDGDERDRSSRYFTAVKSNADWIATLAHLYGMSATVTWSYNNLADESYGDATTKLFTTNIKPRDKAYQSAEYFSTVPYKGDVYCISVPSSYFLVRYNGKICITGNSNMQNWPHALLRFLLFDEGYVGYTVDLSQAENRQVAYIGQVVKMIEAFETGKDVHRLTASMLFMKPYDEISDEPGSAIIGGGHHSERFWGKKSNHSLNYDIGYKTFALVNEIQENQASWIIDHYHMGYPEIRNNFHAGVKRQLAKDRTLTNLMGRKTLFLDAWDDSLWKAGYSCIPQGTTGDIINERGLNYIYYNQDVFEPVELLTQTHDSISFQIPLSTSWEVHSTILNLIEGSLETPLEVHGRKFVIPADFVMGLNFCKDNGVELKELDAESLKGAYETLCQTRNETSQTG